MEATADTSAAPLTYVEKGRVFLACVVAILLLQSIGWIVAAPVDPDLAVTFTNSEGTKLAAWPALAVLMAVAAALGTVIAGHRLPEAGVFAASVGLAALALRGGSMEKMLEYATLPEAHSRRSLMTSMALDCFLWAGIIATTWGVNALVWRWLWPTRADEPSKTPEASETQVRPRKTTPQAARPPSVWSGWPALVITGIVGAIVIWMTIARTPVATIARTQVIASITASLYLGAMVARYFTGIADARWYVLAAPALALTGYLLGYINADMSWAENGGYKFYALLATTPSHAMARPLAIEYLAVGVAAVLLGFWSGEKIEHVVVKGTS